MLSEKFKTLKSNSVAENGIFIFYNGEDMNEILEAPPSYPVTQFRYHCGPKFQTERAEIAFEEEMGQEDGHENFSSFVGVSLVDGENVILYKVRVRQDGTLDVQKLVSSSFGKARRTKRGGQSQNRFQRLTEEALGRYLQRIREAMNRHFSDPSVVAVLVAGSSPQLRNGLVKNPHLLFDTVRGKIVAQAEAVSEHGEAAMASLLSQFSAERWRSLLVPSLGKKELDMIEQGGEDIVYGPSEIRHYIDSGAAKQLIVDVSISDDMETKAIMQDVRNQGGQVTICSNCNTLALAFQGMVIVPRFAISNNDNIE